MRQGGGAERGRTAQHQCDGDGVGPTAILDAVGDGQVHAVDRAEGVLHRDRRRRAVRMADQRGDAADEPVVAVAVDGEEVTGGQPGVAPLEKGAE